MAGEDVLYGEAKLMRHLKWLWCLTFWHRFEKSGVTEAPDWVWDMRCDRCERSYTVDLNK